MIEAAGLAYPRAPLDAALVQLAAGSLFDALVVSSPGAGKFRLSVLGASLDLETALQLEVGERVRLAVKSTSPLTLELSPAAKSAVEEGSAALRGLPPDLELAIRSFAAGNAAREAAGRFLGARGLGLDASAARGLAALLESSAAEGAALGAAQGATTSAELQKFRNTLEMFSGGPVRRSSALVGQLQVAISGKGAGLADIRNNFVLQTAMDLFQTDPRYDVLRNADLRGPDASRAAAAAMNAAPENREASAILAAGNSLADISRALRVLNADAASRGEGVSYFSLGWVRDGKPEGGFGRVEARNGGATDPASPARVVVTVEMSRLGLIQAAIALAGGAAAVTLAASPAARRLLERDRAGLTEALLKLGLKPDIRFSESPPEPIVPLPRSLDLRA